MSERPSAGAVEAAKAFLVRENGKAWPEETRDLGEIIDRLAVAPIERERDEVRTEITRLRGRLTVVATELRSQRAKVGHEHRGRTNALRDTACFQDERDEALERVGVLEGVLKHAGTEREEALEKAARFAFIVLDNAGLSDGMFANARDQLRTALDASVHRVERDDEPRAAADEHDDGTSSD